MDQRYQANTLLQIEFNLKRENKGKIDFHRHTNWANTNMHQTETNQPCEAWHEKRQQPKLSSSFSTTPSFTIKNTLPKPQPDQPGRSSGCGTSDESPMQTDKIKGIDVQRWIWHLEQTKWPDVHAARRGHNAITRLWILMPGVPSAYFPLLLFSQLNCGYLHTSSDLDTLAGKMIFYIWHFTN